VLGVRRTLPEPAAFIRENLRPSPAPMLPEITLFQAHPGSGLARLGATPYWAYLWAGGAALARHILQTPEVARGLCVLDLGAGSGVVGIAAAKAGARRVICADTNPFSTAASALNADINGVVIEVWGEDVTRRPPPEVDLIAAGDVFYAADVGARMARWFDRCTSAGIAVLVGDPGRKHLPRRRLQLLAEYPVRDFGEGEGRPATHGMVFAFTSPQPPEAVVP